MRQILAVRDVAAVLRVTPKTVYCMVKRGELPHFRVSCSIRFLDSEIAKWLQEKSS